MRKGDLGERDLLVIAGDISHDFDVLEESIEALQQGGSSIVFCVGNHEAWLNKKDRFDSIEKIERVYERCREWGVHIEPLLVRGQHPLWIVPMQSWYDGSLSFDEELCRGFEYWPWVDFARCRWPFPSGTGRNARIPAGLVEHFLAQNVDSIELVQQSMDQFPASLMTMSHFLPNKQSLPDWKDLSADDFDTSWLDHGAGAMSAKFAKVAGSRAIDEQIRTLRVDRHLHVFGHSHRPKDFEYNGIRYIHNPLGKPRERELYMVDPEVDFQLLWDVHTGEVVSPTVLRYWEEQGGGKEALWSRMEKVRPGRYQRNRKA